PDEIEMLLRTAIVGRIACCAHGVKGSDGRPYVVPLAYGYDGEAIYAHSGVGRKIRTMRAQPLVSVEVDEAEASDRWRSVIAEGLGGYERSLRREVVVEAPAARVYAAIVTADLHGALLFRVLRPPSGWLGRWHGGVAVDGESPLRLLDLRRFGVLVLAERPPEGVALGAIARLWSVRPSVQRISANFFASATRP